jgi:hypothetical protein
MRKRAGRVGVKRGNGGGGPPGDRRRTVIA